MDLTINTTKSFQKDLQKKFTALPEQQRILAKIEQYGRLFVEDKAAFYQHAYQPCLIYLGEWESSLYVLRLDHQIKVLITIDEDPLFEQVILTLMRIIRTGNLEKVYRAVAESLYQPNFPQLMANSG